MIPDETTMDFSAGTIPPEQPWPGEWPQSRQEFESFVDVFLNRLVCIASNRLRDTEEAEDVVQEVLVKAYINRAKLRKVQRVGPYLYRMVINACIERIRRGRKMISLEDLGSNEILDTCSDTTGQMAHVEGIRHVEELLSRLPVEQAEVLRLRILDEFSLAEIAEIIGCNLSTVKSRLNYGLNKLRRIVCNKEESQ